MTAAGSAHSLNHVLLTERNVTRAAKKVGVTQSAMSRNLASLRALLNDELLVRLSNGMRPTPYALAIQSGLRRNLADLQRLVRTGGTFDAAVAEGTLRVAAPGHMAALITPDLVDRIQREAPGLRLCIEQLDAAHIVRAIEEGVDLALGPMLDLGSAVEGRLVCHDGFACLVSSNHADVSGDRIELETYHKYSQVVISQTLVFGRGILSIADDLGRVGLQRTSMGGKGGAIPFKFRPPGY